MSLNPVRPGLRTIHNGSHDVAKAQIVVASGGELTVPADVADQLQRDGAFKDGPAPKALTDQVQAANEEAAAIAAAEVAAREATFTEETQDAPAAVVVPDPAAPRKKAPAKKSAGKK